MVLKMIKKLPRLSDSIANMPANTMANMPANTMANMPTNTMANMPANTMANMPANTVANMPANTMANMPTNTIANMPAKAPYVVYMDNYFTLVTLFKELRDLQCRVCGTTRPQKGIPSQLVELKDYIKTIL
jgi:hypothetical protein